MSRVGGTMPAKRLATRSGGDAAWIVANQAASHRNHVLYCLPRSGQKRAQSSLAIRSGHSLGCSRWQRPRGDRSLVPPENQRAWRGIRCVLGNPHADRATVRPRRRSASRERDACQRAVYRSDRTMGALNLRQNAFHLLRVSPAASLSEIEEAYEDASFEERASAKVLSDAQKSISTPIKRLGAELSCVFELGPGQFETFMLSLENGEPWAREHAESSFSSLSKANIAAHVCTTHKPGSSISDIALSKWALSLLVESQAGIDSTKAENVINKARSVGGGVPRANNKHVCEGLKNLRVEHRKAALSRIRAKKHPGKAMTAVMEKHGNRQDPAGEFVRDLVRDYDGWSIPKLRKIESKIDTAITRLNNDPSDSAAADKIVRQLAKWDEYSQPTQLLNESLGLDEGRSKVLFEKIRAVAIKLANEDDKHDLALELTWAMFHTFPELPDASSLLSKDLEVLNRTVKMQELLELIGNLRKSPRKYAAALTQRGESERGTKIKVLLDDVFSDPAAVKQENLWMGVRSVAVELHNEHQLSHASLALLRPLYECAHIHGAPKKVRARLSNDMEAISEICAHTTPFQHEYVTSSTAPTKENEAAARRRPTGVSDDPAKGSSDSGAWPIWKTLLVWGFIIMVAYTWLAE